MSKNKNALLKRLKSFGIEIDIGKRWEEGISHHALSQDLAKLIYALDSNGEYSFGGDGDNGETLLYYTDIFFEMLDKNEDFMKNLLGEDDGR